MGLTGMAVDGASVSLTADMAIMDSGSTAILMGDDDAAAVNGVSILAVRLTGQHPVTPVTAHPWPGSDRP